VIVVGLLAAAAGAAPAPSLRASAIGAVVGFAAFAAVAWIGRLLTRKEALGAGDVWLLAGFGAWLGAPALLPVVLLASVQGSVYGLALVALGRSEPGPGTQDANEGSSEAEPPPPEQAEGVGEGDERRAQGQPDEADDWIPPRHAVPFGPVLVAGALEWLYLAPRLAAWLPGLDAFR
jgi:leader peptidase (prepilin peptidase)/N-methyltransferase